MWVCFGCMGSALSLIAISLFAYSNFAIPFAVPVAMLGFCNGAFAVGAIGSMMQLAGQGRLNREGTRMGLWGASQAIAAGFGGLLGTILVDILRVISFEVAAAFGIVFLFEAALFVLAGLMGLKIIESKNNNINFKSVGAL